MRTLARIGAVVAAVVAASALVAVVMFVAVDVADSSYWAGGVPAFVWMVVALVASAIAERLWKSSAS